MIEVIEDTLIDALKLVPFLFLTYLLMEYLEHKTGDKTKEVIKKSGKLGPLFGAILGIVPQCGFSAAAASLYSGRVITMGTLIAVFLSTSDEMLPILISEAAPISLIVQVLLIKLVIGAIAGFIIDAVRGLIIKRKKVSNKEEEAEEVVTPEIEPVTEEETVSEPIEPKSEKKTASSADDKYRTNKVSPEECKRLYRLLEQEMKRNKPYRNPNLKVADLAVAIGTTSHSLSYLFNQYLEKNYYDYINEYRVEEFKSLILKDEYAKYTLTAMAEYCGFSSRASFFRTFKKLAGITPNEYIKQVSGEHRPVD